MLRWTLTAKRKWISFPMQTTYRIPQAPADLLEKARKASPPPKFPRGYFDVLVTPTRLLLDNGFKLTQAAEWLVKEGSLEPQHRQKFFYARPNRLSRHNKKTAAAGEVVQWRTALGYDSVHAVGHGTTALCGVKTASWLGAASTANKCARCMGKAKQQGLIIAE
jgi:hypothetical protein